MSLQQRAWAIWLCGLLLCAAAVSRTSFVADMSAFLPSKPTAEQAVLVDQLKDGLVSRLIMIGLEGGSAAERATLSRSLAARLRADGAFSLVSNGEAAGHERDRALLFEHRYLLSPAVTPQRFTEAGLREAIGASIDGLSSSAGLLLKSLLPADPSGELLALLATLDSERQPRLQDGVWASRDGRLALLLAHTRAAGGDMDAQEAALAQIRSSFEAVRGAAPVQLLLSGPAVFATESRHTIRSEVSQLSLISTVLLVSMLLTVYRSVRTLLLGLVPVLSGVLVAIVAVGAGFGQVHGITLGFGTTLVGEAVDYAIYLFIQGRDGGRNLWPTIRLGVLTSVCGFAALMLSGFPGLAQLGLFSIAGIVAAALVTRFLLPHMLPAGFTVRDLSPLGERFKALLRRAGYRPWPVLALALASAVVVFQAGDGMWNPQLGALSPVPPAQLALDQRLRSEMGAPEAGVLVVVHGADAEAALRRAEALAPRLQQLVADGLIGGYDSPARYLPSQHTQLQRRAALPERQALASALQGALQDLPLRADKLGPFLDAVEAARQAPLLSREDFAGSSLGLALEAMLIPRSQGGWSAMISLRAPASGELDSPRVSAALAGSADVTVVDLGAESTALYRNYLHEAQLLSLAGVLGVLLLLAFTLRRPAAVLRVALPLAAAVLVVCAGLVLAGQRLILLHLVGLLLIVAVGSNYALFFTRGLEAATPRTLASLLLANITTVGGFGLLAFSSVPVLSAIGITVGPGAVLALLFSALLAPREAPRAPAA